MRQRSGAQRHSFLRAKESLHEKPAGPLQVRVGRVERVRIIAPEGGDRTIRNAKTKG